MEFCNHDATVMRQDNLGIVAPPELLVRYRKTMSFFERKANKEAIPDNCLICGKAIQGVCNSHTIPQYCLREIAKEGKLFTPAAIINTNLIDNEIGVREALTFKLICKKCDSEFFKLYETPESLVEAPSSRILGQIATKNLLREISKATRELELKTTLGHLSTPQYDTMMDIRSIDLSEDEKELSTALRIARSNSQSREYRIILYRVLPYVAPFAFQQKVSLVSDFDGKLINNVFNPSPVYRVEPIHVCIFPSKGKTVVLIFRNEKAKRYRSFERRLRALDDEAQLLAIVKLVFAYSEDVLVSKLLPKEVLQNESLTALVQMSDNYIGLGNSFDDCNSAALAQALQDYAIENLPNPPNLLSERYAISQET